MEIAAFLVIHDHPAVVDDTIDSIQCYMTEKILTVVDPTPVFRPITLPTRLSGKRCEVYDHDIDRFKEVALKAHRVIGLKHNHYRAPYRNMILGLQAASKLWDTDWYCYLDYDCLIASDAFRDRLSRTKAWILGNDHRVGHLQFPMLGSLAGVELQESHYLLGCCQFISRKLVDCLQSVNFFDRFLSLTNDFRDGFYPEFFSQGGYDFGEYILPTLAVALGGQVEELGCYHPSGNWTIDKRFMMRFRPEIGFTEEYDSASILHPIKSLHHPIRVYCRKKRKNGY